jgi:two-component system phosphate regulon sensor histidine kinase PhoR
MQKKIVLILVLMSCCVTGITGLQLYWNYKSYQTVVANFKKDANNALDIAVDREMAQRRAALVLKVKKWMNDTSILKITCDTINKDHQTAFTMEDVVPYYADEKADKKTLGIGSFEEKVGKITPAAKATFINHLAEIVKNDLEQSTVHYYTQGLGHRIENEFKDSKLNQSNFGKIYIEELAKRQISTSFKLNTNSAQQKGQFITHKANTAFRRPYVNALIWASLENPNNYYLREMKWLIISSLLLIAITLFCFYHTIKTLLNQHKLVAIKNEFISNMTHEIHTPLSSIQITAEALQRFNLDDETKEKYIDIILYQTKKLNLLSEEILASAKLEHTEFTMNENIDLDELILSLIKHTSLPENINLKYTPSEKNMVIKGNKTHLTRSIANILENAIKYNTSANPTIEFKTARSLKAINLSIIDNGHGIADEFKQKIFEQFYRIPTGNIHNIKGYGLGLSYVKKVISEHKGSIMISDNHPNGSIFSINLPR